MIQYFTRQRIVALFFAVLFGCTNIIPIQAWALTSGPSQPEMASFQPAGVSDMVDLFTGDFKYNIPLLDVDGYPVNLSYQSGVGIDDEASWVGLGWNLNIGSITRQLRGLPDDFSGDSVETEHYTKPKVTIGGKFVAKGEFKGKLGPGLSGQLSMEIFNDNYTGMGAAIGANAGLSLNLVNASSNTAGLGLNAGLGISSSTASGVDVSPSMSLSLINKINETNTTSMGISTCLGYNTRSGLKDLTLSQSFSLSGEVKKDNAIKSGSASLDLGGSSYIFNTDPFYPKPQISYSTRSASFTPSIGGVAWIAFAGIGGTGYVNVRSVKDPVQRKPAYGFLYADRGKKNPEAMMDFNREKDNPVIPDLPNLAVPVYTPDMFSFTSQSGAGQFRLYRGGTGILFDDKAADVSDIKSAGVDVGLGFIFHGGASAYKQEAASATQKWTRDNNYLDKGDFQDNDGSTPMRDAVFFKQVGEKIVNDETNIVGDAIKQDQPVALNISGKSASDKFRTATVASSNIDNPITKKDKAVRRAAISFLTAEEAVNGALDSNIKSYPIYDSNGVTSDNSIKAYSRTARGKNHISEFTITDESGKRMVYGVPTYNLKQEEYTFAVGYTNRQNQTDLKEKNLVKFDVSNSKPYTTGKGVDEYYSCQKQPAYATGFLLSGILSPDYVDVKNDGITDDDRGTAIKFNYSKLPYSIKWRTPVTAGSQMASYNKGLLADPEDEKGTIVYGEKEQWYVQSIETKTKIAYFFLADRLDAVGVIDWKGGIDGTNKQKCLKKIVLYSKADLSKPIKTVEFNYSYKLCPGSINAASGKLTLESVQFTYGKSPKGKNHKYFFSYGNGYAKNAKYTYMSSDRWGTYKSPQANSIASINLRNDEFPYTIQNKEQADDFAAQWLLDKITLPTGGEITVNYESDDYAYVQNKRAMKMIRVDPSTTSNLIDMNQVILDLPEAPGPQCPADQTKWFQDTYLNGSSYLYGRFYVKIANSKNVPDADSYDFVSCYAKIQKVCFTGKKATVTLEPISDGGVTVNPFCIAAWQKMRMEYPKYAYPGYENRPKSGDPLSQLSATVNAIIDAFQTLGELKKSFYERARDKKFASQTDLSKSFVRIVDMSGKKLGGGVRVKRISISDNWQQMSGSSGNATTYGMEYDYTTIENGKTISSGVASYEPSLGNDENPLRQPVPYLQKIKGALNNLFYLEQPFGESYFPAPSVGYRKVTVRNIGETGTADPQNKTGWTVSEFYTAKEFPTLVSTTDMKKTENGPRNNTNLFGGFQIHELTLSQGYAIYTNDMHGKPRSEKIFDKNGSLISSAEYIYNQTPIGAGEWQLANDVQTINTKGEVSTKTLGRDIELFMDMRESEFSSYGTSLNLGGDFFVAGIWPVAVPHWPKKNNDEYRLFRSACAVKLVQSYGIMQKVIKVQNGSQITAENVAFDPYTGDVLITKTTNEFEQPIYSVNIPAYWIYPKMSGAYTTANTYIQQLGTDANGILTDASFLQAGDELVSKNPAVGKLWVVENKEIINGNEATVTKKRLIDKNGVLVTNFSGPVKVLRSGNRNLISASTSSIICLKNPIEQGHLKLTANSGDLKDLKIIDAKTTLYNEDWAGDWALPCAECPSGYSVSPDGEWCEADLLENYNECMTLCQGDYTMWYSMNGAYIKPYSNSTSWNPHQSYFWINHNCHEVFCNNKMLRSASQNVATDSSQFGKGEISTEGSSEMRLMAAPVQVPCDTRTKICREQCGRLPQSAVWFCRGLSGADRLPLKRWIGIETYIVAPETKTYYIGYASDNRLRLYVNDTKVRELTYASSNDDANFNNWYVEPVTLHAGKNLIKIEGYNDHGPAAVGVEVYDNTYYQLINEIGINIIWSTADLLTSGKKIYTYTINDDGSINPRYVCSNGGKPDILNDLACDRIRRNRVNPYMTGFKGNWRPIESKTFLTNRSYGNQTAPEQSGVNAKKDGHYQSFVPYWVYDGTWKGSTDQRWVSAATMTLYDRYGQELENKDALGRYSAALFGFYGNLSTAVASNAQNREVLYEGFEDLRFRKTNKAKYNLCDTGAVSFDAWAANVYNTDAHTGKYSLRLNTPVILKPQVHSKNHLSEPYLTVSELGEYLYKRTTGLYYRGFEPVTSKQYIMSFWVKDGQPLSKTTSVSVNAAWADCPLTWKATVEGWKLYETVFTAPDYDIQMQIQITGSSSVLMDDLRIMPAEAQMKTYSYDESNFRLMAELDENNFATFYEYDDEGTLNRVKKETEKGIMTIKETRSTYRKQN